MTHRRLPDAALECTCQPVFKQAWLKVLRNSTRSASS